MKHTDQTTGFRPATHKLTAAKLAAPRLAAALLLGSALVLPWQANAVEPNYALNYSPAQLTSNTSVQALHQRIRQLARQACPSYFVERDLRGRADCIKNVELELVNKVNNPRLSAVHRGEPLDVLAQY